jgi:hypothetical protein
MGLPTSSRYWSAAQGRVVVEAWRQSGEAAAVFARRHGLQPKRLRYWATQLSRAEGPSLTLVPVMGAEMAAVIHQQSRRKPS